MKRVVQNIDLLKTVYSCKKCLWNSLIKQGSKEFIAAICECIDNLLAGKISISPVQHEKLSKFKRVLRQLVKKDSLGAKKKLLEQHGGFLEYLIPAAVTAIGSLISNAISDK